MARSTGKKKQANTDAKVFFDSLPTDVLHPHPNLVGYLTKQGGVGLDQDAFVNIFQQLFAQMAFWHAKKLLLSPPVTPFNFVLDTSEESLKVSLLTNANGTLSSLEYLSPYQIKNQVLDPTCIWRFSPEHSQANDLWALGKSMLYALLPYEPPKDAYVTKAANVSNPSQKEAIETLYHDFNVVFWYELYLRLKPKEETEDAWNATFNDFLQSRNPITDITDVGQLTRAYERVKESYCGSKAGSDELIWPVFLPKFIDKIFVVRADQRLLKDSEAFKKNITNLLTNHLLNFDCYFPSANVKTASENLTSHPSDGSERLKTSTSRINRGETAAKIENFSHLLSATDVSHVSVPSLSGFVERSPSFSNAGASGSNNRISPSALGVASSSASASGNDNGEEKRELSIDELFEDLQLAVANFKNKFAYYWDRLYSYDLTTQQPTKWEKKPSKSEVIYMRAALLKQLAEVYQGISDLAEKSDLNDRMLKYMHQISQSLNQNQALLDLLFEKNTQLTALQQAAKARLPNLRTQDLAGPLLPGPSGDDSDESETASVSDSGASPGSPSSSDDLNSQLGRHEADGPLASMSDSIQENSGAAAVTEEQKCADDRKLPVVLTQFWTMATKTIAPSSSEQIKKKQKVDSQYASRLTAEFLNKLLLFIDSVQWIDRALYNQMQLQFWRLYWKYFLSPTATSQSCNVSKFLRELCEDLIPLDKLLKSSDLASSSSHDSVSPEKAKDHTLGQELWGFYENNGTQAIHLETTDKAALNEKYRATQLPCSPTEGSLNKTAAFNCLNCILTYMQTLAADFTYRDILVRMQKLFEASYNYFYGRTIVQDRETGLERPAFTWEGKKITSPEVTWKELFEGLLPGKTVSFLAFLKNIPHERTPNSDQLNALRDNICNFYQQFKEEVFELSPAQRREFRQIYAQYYSYDFLHNLFSLTGVLSRSVEGNARAAEELYQLIAQRYKDCFLAGQSSKLLTIDKFFHEADAQRNSIAKWLKDHQVPAASQHYHQLKAWIESAARERANWQLELSPEARVQLDETARQALAPPVSSAPQV